MVLGKKLGIDLGSTAIRIAVKGEGVVLSEPSVLAMRAGSGNAIAFGASAAHVDAAPDVGLIHPMRDGMAVDEAAVELLLSLAVSRVVGRQRIFKPDMVIVVMSALPGEQRRALLDVATRTGARTVYLLDAPIAAAMGGRLDLSDGDGHLVVDAGGGKTEVCALVEEGTLAGRCLPGGTGRLGEAVAEHVRDRHGLDLDEGAVGELLLSLGAAGPDGDRRLAASGGGSVTSEARLSSAELSPFVDAYAGEVVAALAEVLDEVPPHLRDDIQREGILLTGGAARLHGLDRHLAAASGVAVRVAAEPELCAVRGAGKAVDNLDMLKRNVMYLR
ncbi:MAG: rod shape-determining protein [Candidatus Dormibacteria bacterium]